MKIFSLLLWTTTLLLLGNTVSGQDDAECSGLIQEFYLEEGSDGLPLWIRWTVNVNTADPSKSTLTLQYEVLKQAWLAFGIAATDGMMDGAEVVVGLPETGEVLKYRNEGYMPVPMPAESQTLMNATVVQNEQGTILTYTKFLEEEGELPIVPGMVLTTGASGVDNTFGYHGPARGAGPFPLFPDCVDGVLQTTPAPTPAPTSAAFQRMKSLVFGSAMVAGGLLSVYF